MIIWWNLLVTLCSLEKWSWKQNKLPRTLRLFACWLVDLFFKSGCFWDFHTSRCRVLPHPAYEKICLSLKSLKEMRAVMAVSKEAWALKKDLRTWEKLAFKWFQFFPMLLNEESRHDCHGVLFGVRLADRFMSFMPQHQLLRRNLMSKERCLTCAGISPVTREHLWPFHICAKKTVEDWKQGVEPLLRCPGRKNPALAGYKQSKLPCGHSVCAKCALAQVPADKRNYLVASVRLASTLQ